MVLPKPIFIPGLLCTDWLFHPQVDILPGDAVFCDTLKHDTIAEMAESALTQITGPLVPIGLSMGGYVALEMARRAPDRISAMALFSTSCCIDNLDQRTAREQAIKLSEQDGFRGITRHFLAKFLSPQAMADASLVDGVLQMAAEVGCTTFARQQKAILTRRAQHAVLKEFLPPLLIVCGMNDRVTPPHLSQEMAALAPHADLRLLPDVGHLSTLEAPQECRSALIELLASI